MALMKKANRSLEEEIERSEEVVESVRAEAEEKNLTLAESEAIISQMDTDKEAGASTKKMEKATALISGKFNLDDTFCVTNFSDKGKVIKTTVENRDFILSVTIKDSDRHGLVFDD